MLTGISTVTGRLASLCTPTTGLPGGSPATGRSCATGVSRSSGAVEAFTIDAVLSAGQPGTLHSATHLLDGIARMLADEADRSGDVVLAERLAFLTVDVIDTLDMILDVAAA